MVGRWIERLVKYGRLHGTGERESVCKICLRKRLRG